MKKLQELKLRDDTHIEWVTEQWQTGIEDLGDLLDKENTLTTMLYRIVERSDALSVDIAYFDRLPNSGPGSEEKSHTYLLECMMKHTDRQRAKAQDR